MKGYGTEEPAPDVENGVPPKRTSWLWPGVALGAVLLLAAASWAHKNHQQRHPSAATSDELKGYTARWVPFEAREHPDRPTSIWGKLRRPYPTGAWWTNLVVGGPSSKGDGLGSAMQTPYAVSVTKAGVALSYGALSATNESLTLSVSADTLVTMAEGVARRYVMTYDELTMTMRLDGKDGGTIDALFARGSPYMTLLFDEAAPVVSSDFGIKSLEWLDAPEDMEKPAECSAYATCVAASMKGDCCPMDEAHGNVVHPCCRGPLAAQGPGNRFSLELKNGQKWRVYTSTPTVFEWDDEHIKGKDKMTGILRLALVPDESGLSGDAALSRSSNATEGAVPDAIMLDAHAESYPTAGEARITADRWTDATLGHVVFEWRVAYMGSTLSLESDARTPALLMLALPHHKEALIVDESLGFLPPGSLDYRCGLKGPCAPVLGARWSMAEKLTTISWLPPGMLLMTETEKNVLRQQLVADVTRPAGDTDQDAAWIAYNDYFGNAYWNGKECARIAGLALVAEYLNDEHSLASATAQLRAILDLWLEGKNADPLVYDATYGGLVTTKGLYDHDADFGSGYYNDHHFHYGYMLYAAAVAAKLDAGFVSKYRPALFALMYDVANPGTGASLFEPGIDRSAFPRARHKDFYDGHSWASGIFFMGQGKAQESSTEAINCYYGAYLLALAIGDVELADWNRVLLATEIRAAKLYYHMPADTLIYPKNFAHNKMVGVLGALSTGTVTWFGPSTAFSHGIQILPVTPITELVLDPPSFITEDLHFLDNNLDRATCDPAWLAFLEAERAVVDKKQAWDNLYALDYVDSGTTKTWLLFWIATRPPLTTSIV